MKVPPSGLMPNKKPPHLLNGTVKAILEIINYWKTTCALISPAG